MIKKLLAKYRTKVALHPSITALQCNTLIAAAIKNKIPFLAGRMGWVEGYAIGTLLTEKKISDKLQKNLSLNAGVFPTTHEHLHLFSTSYLEAAKQADILGLLYFPLEGWLFRSVLKKAKRADLSALEPYFSSDPWSWQLRGKKVLVVHPFAESISKQYATAREKLFANPKILPAFELRTLRAPQTVSGNKTEYPSWYETLQALEKQIAAESFEIAILGCGAYGLPLGAAIKKMGKVAVHLGGATQLLFGVSGARWRQQSAFQALMNDFWKPPLEEERPFGWENIEQGCYW